MYQHRMLTLRVTMFVAGLLLINTFQSEHHGNRKTASDTSSKSDTEIHREILNRLQR
jgi:hypothetical protein